MIPSRILFLRVGMSLEYGALGPLFPGGSFEYVPIPEKCEVVSSRCVLFSQIPARSGGTIEQFVPHRYRGTPAHYDPEFDTFTYGDPARNKRTQLLHLNCYDLLVFYAGLRPLSEKRGSKLYLIGYFTVQKVYKMDMLEPWPPPGLQHLWTNAHFKRKNGDSNLVVVKGFPQGSRLLEKAVPLSDSHQKVLPELENHLGMTGSLKRAGAGRWIPATNVDLVAKWLFAL
ncbi:MAG: hypothetical protein ABIF87_04810 [Pseudomonadota bacterium]